MQAIDENKIEDESSRQWMYSMYNLKWQKDKESERLPPPPKPNSANILYKTQTRIAQCSTTMNALMNSMQQNRRLKSNATTDEEQKNCIRMRIIDFRINARKHTHTHRAVVVATIWQWNHHTVRPFLALNSFINSYSLPLVECVRACVRVPVNEFVLINRLFSVDHPCHSTAACVVLYCFAFVCLFHGQLLFFLSFFRCPMFMPLSLYSKHELFLQLYLQRTALYCWHLLYLIVIACHWSHQTKIKLNGQQKREKKKTDDNNNNQHQQQGHCVFIWYITLFASTFSLLIIKSKWMPSISGLTMIHFASQFILVHPFIINIFFALCLLLFVRRCVSIYVK